MIVICNSDPWLKRKKGNYFMNLKHRIFVVQNIKAVDEAVSFEDSNDSADMLLVDVRKRFPENSIFFGNGGDRSDIKNIRESKVASENRIELKFGIGGSHKESSSSDLLGRWNDYILSKEKVGA